MLAHASVSAYSAMSVTRQPITPRHTQDDLYICLSHCMHWENEDTNQEMMSTSDVIIIQYYLLVIFIVNIKINIQYLHHRGNNRHHFAANSPSISIELCISGCLVNGNLHLITSDKYNDSWNLKRKRWIMLTLTFCVY